jgi:hypothetical protein
MYSKLVNLLIKDEKTGKDVQLKINPGIPFTVIWRGIIGSGVSIDKRKLKNLIEQAAWEQITPTGGDVH